MGGVRRRRDDARRSGAGNRHEALDFFAAGGAVDRRSYCKPEQGREESETEDVRLTIRNCSRRAEFEEGFQ